MPSSARYSVRAGGQVREKTPSNLTYHPEKDIQNRTCHGFRTQAGPITYPLFPEYLLFLHLHLHEKTKHHVQICFSHIVMLHFPVRGSSPNLSHGREHLIQGPRGPLCNEPLQTRRILPAGKEWHARRGMVSRRRAYRRRKVYSGRVEERRPHSGRGKLSATAAGRAFRMHRRRRGSRGMDIPPYSRLRRRPP